MCEIRPASSSQLKPEADRAVRLVYVQVACEVWRGHDRCLDSTSTAAHPLTNPPRGDRATSAIILAGCLAAAVLSRLPTRTDFLFSWDAVNFALAMDHWDLSLHQPHPPG